MKTSQVFKQAKTRLWKGDTTYRGPDEERYICNTIRFDFKIPHKNKQKPLDIIEKLLAPHDTLEDWLCAKHKIRYWGNPHKVQQTRHAWLDHLIEHYESIED